MHRNESGSAAVKLLPAAALFISLASISTVNADESNTARAVRALKGRSIEELMEMFMVHSSCDLPKDFEFDAVIRYVGRLPNPAVPSYMELDLRLGWRATRSLDFDVIGRNLLDRSHPEFGAKSPLRREVERSVYGRVTWRF
jgi:hypothetical protein